MEFYPVDGKGDDRLLEEHYREQEIQGKQQGDLKNSATDGSVRNVERNLIEISGIVSQGLSELADQAYEGCERETSVGLETQLIIKEENGY